jgi:alkylation response protein AidB-like acyl-CoA dehydrogenase
MYGVFMSRCMLITALTLFVLVGELSSLCAQTSTPAKPVVEQNTTVDSVVDALQASQLKNGNAFIEQDEINCFIREGGGGPCASCAGIIVLQICRGIIGLSPVENPHRAFAESVRDQDELLNGRVTNRQFAKLIAGYQKYLPDTTIQTQILSAPNSPYAVGNDIWGDDRPLTIQTDPATIQVLSFTWTTGNGEVLGRHFVIVRAIVDGQIHVVDPAAPTKKRRFVLEKGSHDRVFLRMPPDLPQRDETFELNTVFTVRLNQSSSGPSQDKGRISLEHIEAKIDQTADKLRTIGKLRSPRDWRRETASLGLPGLDLPLDIGGSGWNAEKTLEVFRHAGRQDLNLRDVVGGAHSRILLKSQNAEVRDVLKKVVSGDAYFAIAITEPDAGTDFTAIQTSSTKVDGGYRLNGHKRFNARLEQATHVIVFAKSASGNDGRLSVFLLPIETEGLTVESFGAHGLNGNSYGGLILENVLVPDSHRIGEEDDGYKIFNEHFAYWRLMQTAAAIGTAEKALDMMAERLKTREVYGKPIGRFTHLQQPLGQHSTELKMAYSLAKEAARLLDQGRYKEAEKLVCGLKAEGVEIAINAVDAAARAFGGEGYSDRVDIGDRLRDLNGLRIADGTTDAMRSAVVMHTFGKEFWDMAFKDNRKAEAIPAKVDE